MSSKDTRLLQAAARSGLTVGYISRVMNGKRDPRLSTATLIAASMHISLDVLLQEIDRRVRSGIPAEVSRRVRDGLRRHREKALENSGRPVGRSSTKAEAKAVYREANRG